MAARAHNPALALAAEFAAIHGAEQPITDLESYRRSAAAVDQSALRLSGAGFIGSRLSLRDSADYLTSQTSNGALIRPMAGSPPSLKVPFDSTVAAKQWNPGGHHGIRRTATLADVAG